ERETTTLSIHGRREFLKFSLAGAGALAAGKLARGAAAPSAHRPLGVQLYTVRDAAERDLPGVLAAVRKIGYREVETYWNVYTHPAVELRRMITDHGLRVPSGHFDYDGLESKIDYAKTLGVQYMICPMLPEKMWNELDGYKSAAAQLNVWGEKVQKAGMQLGFHNHNYEFKRFGGTTGFATLMNETDAKLVCLEMDCYWIVEAGEDPLKMMERYSNRIKEIHLKDRKSGFPTSQVKDAAAEHFTEVGSGTIHWKPILAAAEKLGIKHFYVERDSGDLPPLESLRISFEYLQPLM
ncbi:MAG: sugar phosphate isomerase/epimerase, partial [Candidatus Acidiferrales bacterium]